MEIKFFSNGKVMDLSGQELSVSDSNSKVSDKVSTKYLFPFEFYMDEEFKKSFGDYSSFDSYNLPTIIAGQLLYENVYHIAKLEILGNQGDYLTGQIDFGFEDVPNFDKPLKDLPLERFDVDDIHTFAAQICAQKYPQTNFNFPRLHNGQYSPDDELWDAFNGFMNDMNDNGSALRNNYVTEAGDIFNVNIIHPMPHILYLLKTGFADANYHLDGDILTEPLLAQQWVFSATEYFSRLTLRKLGLTVSVMDYQERFKKKLRKYPYGRYDSSVAIPKPGNYKIIARIMLATYKSGLDTSWISVMLNGKQILYRSSGGELIFTFETDITTVNPNEEIRVVGFRSFGDGDTEKFIELKIVSKNSFENEDAEPGEDNGVITNPNEIDLTRAVPDITFGELVNRIRNFLNYDITAVGNIIYMNRIKRPDQKDVKMIPEKFLVLKPARNTLKKRSFAIQMPAWENDEKPDSVYYDSSGVQINKKYDTEITTVIETNTYALPVYAVKSLGPETAVVKSYNSSILQLVKYDGKTGIQNNAKASPELTFPALFFTHWIDWLRGRLNSYQFEWTFTAEDDEIDFTIKDAVGAYQNIHIITDWVKDYDENSVTVNIKTETVN